MSGTVEKMCDRIAELKDELEKDFEENGRPLFKHLLDDPRMKEFQRLVNARSALTGIPTWEWRR